MMCVGQITMLGTLGLYSTVWQFGSVQFSCSVMSDSLHCHELQASLSITSPQLRLTSIESVTPSNYLIL